VKHHLGLRIILLPETHGAFIPQDPRKSHPERDAHGFVFAAITAAALTVTVIVAQVIAMIALIITIVVILLDRAARPPAAGLPPLPLAGPTPQPQWSRRQGGGRTFIVIEAPLVARGSYGGSCHHRSSGGFLLRK
jgi:hypothetical protein